jgi:hypothetical protein
MSIAKLCPDAVEVVCLCGAPTVVPLAAIRVSNSTAIFPLCPVCHNTQISITVPQGPVAVDVDADIQARTRAAKGVVAQLHRLAGTADAALVEAVAVDALPWPVDMPATVPLAAVYAKAATTWREAHPNG